MWARVRVGERARLAEGRRNRRRRPFGRGEMAWQRRAAPSLSSHLLQEGGGRLVGVTPSQRRLVFGLQAHGPQYRLHRDRARGILCVRVCVCAGSALHPAAAPRQRCAGSRQTHRPHAAPQTGGQVQAPRRCAAPSSPLHLRPSPSACCWARSAGVCQLPVPTPHHPLALQSRCAPASQILAPRWPPPLASWPPTAGTRRRPGAAASCGRCGGGWDGWWRGGCLQVLAGG